MAWLLGVLLGQGAVRLVTQTINDLFFVVNVHRRPDPGGQPGQGGCCGLAATHAHRGPARLGGRRRCRPRAALSRSGLEDKARQAVRRVALGGLLLTLLGLGVLLLPTRSLVVGFGGTFAVVIGFAMLTPLATVALMRAALPVTAAGGQLGRMAPRDACNRSAALPWHAALMVAVSVTIGVSLMVGSFRCTVETWLGQTLAGDVYISAPSRTAAKSCGDTRPGPAAELAGPGRGWPCGYPALGDVELPSGRSTFRRSITPIDDARLYRWRRRPGGGLAGMQAGAVIVSEPFASRLGWKGPVT